MEPGGGQFGKNLLLRIFEKGKRGGFMTVETVVDIMQSALYTIIITAAPLLLISLVVGLIISIFQTATSIQEQTLTFVPKIVAVFCGMMMVGSWMINTMITYMVDLWSDFSLYIR